MPEVSRLSLEECDRLLRAGVFGRVAFSTRERPEIVPVNYRVLDDAIWIRTEPDGFLARCLPGRALALEIDLVDYERWNGWSVVAHGTGVLVTDAEALEIFAERPAPRPWAAGERTTYIRVRWTELSGRKLGKGWDCYGSMPARLAL